MNTINSTLKRLLAVIVTVACLGMAGAVLTASPAAASPGSDDRTSVRDHGDDDPPGDDNGGENGGGGGGGDDRVVKTGACKGGPSWKLKVKTDDGRLEVEGEVDSNTTGQKWGWKIKHNGSVSAKGTSTTSGPSGSFSVERKIVNLNGSDRVVFRAVHDGQSCRGVINY
jgi:hypothetical protein